MKGILAGAIAALFGVSAVAADYVPLANTVRKLKAGSLRVAVVGDSIGWGQGAGAVTIQGVRYGMRVKPNSAGMPKGNPMGYARTFTDYVKHVAKAKYGVPDSKIETFYSVWGGATTVSAFAYFTQDILARRPDLLLYQVWNPSPEALRYAEATLRELWAVSPETDVILFSVGGCFASPAVHKPLVAKYGLPFVDGVGKLEAHFAQFGRFHSNEYVMQPDGLVRGTRGYLFGSSCPHVNEEGYVWFNDRLIAGLDALLDRAAPSSGACERVAPAGSLEGEPIAAKGEFMGSAAVISPASLLAAGAADAAQWKASVAELADEPRDTADRATGDRLTAVVAGATVEVEVRGRQLFFRGNDGLTYSADGGRTFAPARGLVALPAGEGRDFVGKVILKAAKKGAWFNEFYVYAAGRTGTAARPAKHRWSVSYFARVAEKHHHDWELGGKRVIPHALSWLNVFRDETYAKTLKVAGPDVISSECATNGAFLGWVEPDGIEWKGSERLMTVKGYEGKRIYKPGETLDPAALGRDLTLVAAFAGGPFPAACARTVKAVFVADVTAGAKTVAILDAPAASPVVTLPELPKRPYHVAKGWKAINTSAVLAPGTKVTLGTDTEYVVDWAFDGKDRTGLSVSDTGLAVDILKRVGSLRACFDAEICGERCGTFGAGSEETGWPFACNGMAYLVSRAEDGFIRAKVTNDPSYWKYPTFYGFATLPVKLSSVKGVTVAYRYEPAKEPLLAGQHLNLQVKARSADGLSTVTLQATSAEPIAAGGTQTAHFAFKPPEGNDNFVAAIELKFYDVNGMNRAVRLSAANFGKGSAFCLGPVTFLR